MAPRPKVPFALHPALQLRSNTAIAHGSAAALSPDGATAAVTRGEYGQSCLELHTLATGAVAVALPPQPAHGIEHPVWSRDGRRWAVGQLRFDGNNRTGLVFVGERGRADVLSVTRTAAYGAVTLNAQARPSPLLAFSPDGERLVLRVCGGDDRNALMHITAASGEVREQWLDPSEQDVFAHAFADDGTLYTAGAWPGDTAGLAWYRPGTEGPAGRLAWPHGLVIVPTGRGLWVLGNPSCCFRVVPGPATPIAPAVPSRRDRLEALRARASTRWDQEYLDLVLQRLPVGPPKLDYHPSRGVVQGGVDLPQESGFRVLEHELSWETSFAARIGDDDVVVSDGVGVWRWRDDGAALTRILLADDTQRCTHRAPRIIGLSTAGDTLALLWKQDAHGAKTTLSLFDVDRPALGG